MESNREAIENLRQLLLQIQEEVLKEREPWSKVFSPSPEIWDWLKKSKPSDPYFTSLGREEQEAFQTAYELLKQICLSLSGQDGVVIRRASFPSPNRQLLSIVKSFHRSHGNERKYVLIPQGEQRKWSESAELTGYELKPLRLNAKEWVNPLNSALEKYGRDIAAFALTFPNPSFAFPRDFPATYDLLQQLNIPIVVDARYSQSLLGQINSQKLGLDLMLWDESTFTGDRFPPSQSLGIYLAKSALLPHLPAANREIPYGVPYREAYLLLSELEEIGLDQIREKSSELALRRRFLREEIFSGEPEKFVEPLPSESNENNAPRVSTPRYAPYDFFAKVRGNESLDRLNAFLLKAKSTEPGNLRKTDVENRRENSRSHSYSFEELHFSSKE